MSKAVLLSIRPEWCEKIANKVKSLEIRKTVPKLKPPFKVYIYCTSGPPYLNSHNGYVYLEDRDVLGYRGQGLYCRLNHGVIGEFVCHDIFPIRVFENGSIQDYMFHRIERSLVPYDDIADYIGKGKTGYGWIISDLVIYETPRSLLEIKGFRKTKFGMEPVTLTRPPQSWCYVEEIL